MWYDHNRVTYFRFVEMIYSMLQQWDLQYGVTFSKKYIITLCKPYTYCLYIQLYKCVQSFFFANRFPIYHDDMHDHLEMSLYKFTWHIIISTCKLVIMVYRLLSYKKNDIFFHICGCSVTEIKLFATHTHWAFELS